MAEINPTIRFDVQTGPAVARIRELQAAVNTLNRQLVATNQAAAASQLGNSLIRSANATGMFRGNMVSVASSVDQFTDRLERNKLSLREYTRYAASQLPGMSKRFRTEFDTMQSVAETRVRKIATSYTQLGDAIHGAQKAIALTPTGALNMKDYATQSAVAAQKAAIFNKILSDGSTKLLNWGKNTQWAGRQLMVGFSIPMAAFAVAAGKAFAEIDKASISFKRVYGDLNTTTAEMNSNLEAVKALGAEYTKYGIAVKDTIDIAARAAATGATNESLMAATKETLRLATLGQMEYNTALDATISMQTAFQSSNEDLAKNIDFLNAVENQTVLTLQDMALAIPRVAPVIKGLGGDVKDLAIMMTAMREGGVTAENAANALKSGLASLINPTTRAKEALEKFGIDLSGILKNTRGDVLATIQQFGEALSTLDGFSQQQALEQIFGKYQYARMGALFKNIINDSGQAARAMDLAGESAENLAALSEKELGKISESTSVKFKAAMEQIKMSIAPIGEQFMKIAIPVIDFFSKMLDKFNQLPDALKNGIVLATSLLAGIGPVILMTVGLLANGLANITKGVLLVRKAFHTIRGSSKGLDYIEMAAIESSTAIGQLDGKLDALTGTMYLQRPAIQQLIVLYEQLGAAAATAAGIIPTGGPLGRGGRPVMRGFNSGVVKVPGSGNGDIIPALLTPGESVITKEATQKYAPILQAINDGSIALRAAGGDAATGGDITTERYRDDPSKPVRSHGTAAVPLSDAELREYQRREALKTRPNQAVLSAISATGMTGWIYGEPQAANDRMLTGTERGAMFSGRSPEMRSQILTPLMTSILRQANPGEMLDEPQIRGFVSKIGDNMATGLTQVGSAIVKDEVFQRIDRESFDRALADSPDLTPANRRAILAARNNIETLSLQGPNGNAGRINVSERSYRNVPLPRSGVPIDPFLTPEGDAARDRERAARAAQQEASLRERSRRSTQPRTTPVEQPIPTPSRRMELALERYERSERGSGGALPFAGSESGPPARKPLVAIEAGPEGRAEQAAAREAERLARLPKNRRELAAQYKKTMDSTISSAYHAATRAVTSSMKAVGNAAKSLGALAKKTAEIPTRMYAAAQAMQNETIRTVSEIRREMSKSIKKTVSGLMTGTSRIPEIIDRAIERTSSAARMARDSVANSRVVGLGRDMGQALMNGDPRSAAAMVKNAAMNTAAGQSIAKSAQFISTNMKRAAVLTKDVYLALANNDPKSAVRMVSDSFRNVAREIGQTRVGQKIASIGTNVSAAMANLKTGTEGFVAAAKTAARAILAGDMKSAVGAIIPGADRRMQFMQTQFGQIAKVNLYAAFKVAEAGIKNGAESFRAAVVSGAQSVRTSFNDFKAGTARAATAAWEGIKKTPSLIVSGAKKVSGAFTTAASNIAAGAVMAAKRIVAGGVGGGGGIMGFFKGQTDAEGNPIGSRASRAFSRGAMPASMILGMGSMLPMMNQDENGKWMGMDAGGAMMGMMGGSAILGMAPMLGPAAGPVLAVAAAATALAVGLKIWRSSVDENAKKSAELGASMGGTANALNKMAAVLGKQTPAQMQALQQMQLSADETEKFGEFQNQLESEAGQNLIKELAAKSGGERVKYLTDYIQNAIAAGLLDLQSGGTFAKAVGAALSDSALATKTISQFQSQGTGASSMLKLANERLRALEESAAVNEVRGAPSIGQEGFQRSIATDVSSFAIGGSVQIIQDFANVIALARQEYLDGTMSYERYIDILNEASSAQKEYTSILTKSVANASDMQGARQALDAQMIASGMSQEAVDAITHATDIGTTSAHWAKFSIPFTDMDIADFSGQKDMSAYMSDYVDRAAEEDYGKAASQLAADEFAAVQAEAEKAQAAAAGMFENGLNEHLKIMVLAGKATAEQAAALGAELMNNSLSAAAMQYRRQAAAGNEILGLEQAAFMQTTEIAGVAGLNDAQVDKYIDIGIRFSEDGGNLAQYMSTMEQLPRKVLVDIVTNFSGPVTPRMLDILSNVTQNNPESTAEVASPYIADMLARASQQRAVAEASKPSVVDPNSPDGRAMKARADSIAAAAALAAEELEKQAEEAADSLAKATEAGVSDKVIEYVFKTTGDEEVSEVLDTVTGQVTALEALPKEILLALDIDTQDPEDLATFGDKSDVILRNWDMLKALDPDIDISMVATAALLDEDGNPIEDPTQVSKNIMQINKAYKLLGNAKTKPVLHNMQIKVATQFLSEEGKALGATGKEVVDQAREWLDAIGKDLDDLTPAATTKVLQVTSKIVDKNAKISAKMAGLMAARDKLMSGPQNMVTLARIQSINEEIAALQTQYDNNILEGMADVQTAGITGGGGSNNNGGNGGGGGGGDKSNPFLDWKKDILNQIKMYADSTAKLKDLLSAKYDFLDLLNMNNGVDDKIRALGLPPVLAEYLMGLDPKDALKIIKKITNKAGDLTKQGRRFVGQYMYGNIAATLDEARASRQGSNAQMAAMASMDQRNVPAEAYSIIAGDPEKAKQYVYYLSEIKRIQKEMDQTEVGSAKWKKLKEQLQAIKKDLREYIDLLVKARREEEAAATLSDMRHQAEQAPATLDLINQAREQGLSQDAIDAIASGDYTAAYQTLDSTATNKEKKLANATEQVAEAQQAYNKAMKYGTEAEQEAAEAALEKAKRKAAKAQAEYDEAVTARDNFLADVEKDQALDDMFAYASRPDEFMAEKMQETFDDISAVFDKKFLELEDASEAGFAAAWGQSKEAAEELIEDNKILIKQYDDQISLLENQNEVDNLAIKGLERKKKKWNDLIDTAQKAIDKFQEVIDGYQRTIDLTNHKIDLLNHDLDLISNSEEKINEAYDKRIEALDEVAALNDHILAQQQNQLNIARALTTGDVYAAAQAQQEMQAQQVQYASQQARAGLEQGRDNAIAGLRNAQGMTRDQIEEQIFQYQQQNYQLGLLIYDQEQLIYAENQKILEYKKEIATVDDSIRVYTDKIWEREGQILEIQKLQQPLIHNNELWQNRLDTSQQLLDDAKSDAVIYGLTLKQHERINRIMQTNYKAQQAQNDLANGYLEIWKRIGEGITNAREAMLGDLEAVGAGNYAAVANPFFDPEAFLLPSGEYDVAGMLSWIRNQGSAEMENWFQQGNDFFENTFGAGGTGVPSDTVMPTGPRVIPGGYISIKKTRREGNVVVDENGNPVNGWVLNDTGSTIEQDGTDWINGMLWQYNSGKKGSELMMLSKGGGVPGSGVRDSVPAFLSPGEFVMRRAAVQKYGMSTFEKMNMGSFAMPHYNMPQNMVPSVTANNTNVASISAPVYNTYSINVPVTQPNASADEIANKVITRIRNIEDRSIRRINGY